MPLALSESEHRSIRWDGGCLARRGPRRAACGGGVTSLGLFHAGRTSTGVLFLATRPVGPVSTSAVLELTSHWGRIIELASGPGRRGNVAQR